MKTARRIEEIKPSATLAMAARAAALRREGKPIISLTTGEPDFDTPQPIKEAAHQAIREGFTKYTPASGIPELREAIRDRIRRDYGVPCETDQVIVCCGAKHALFNALMAICNPGDEVVFFSPYWTSYPDMVRAVGGIPVVAVTKHEEGYVPTPSALEEAVTERTRVLILNSPNNPTGAVYSESVLKALGEVIRGKEIAVLTDDIYDRLVYGEERFASITSVGEEIRERTVIVGGVSKTYSMTGWRIGYAAGPREVIKGMSAIQSHTTSNPTSISQKAALAAITGPDDEIRGMCREFGARRIEMVSLLKSIRGIHLVEPMGAFFTFPRVQELYGRKVKGRELRGSLAMAEALLEEENVAVVPGVAFGDDGAIRLSYALAMDAMKEGVSRIRRFLMETLK